MVNSFGLGFIGTHMWVVYGTFAAVECVCGLALYEVGVRGAPLYCIGILASLQGVQSVYWHGMTQEQIDGSIPVDILPVSLASMLCFLLVFTNTVEARSSKHQ